MKAKVNLENVIAYLQGTIRYKMYYSRWFSWMIREHIRDQIDWRIEIMDKRCYNQGSCIMCGCKTTALQMADKQCDKPCYPPMLNRKGWYGLNIGLKRLRRNKHQIFYKLLSNGKLEGDILKHGNHSRGK